jgi:hypothetical protein
MKLKLTLAAVLAAPSLGACTTDEVALFGDVLSLYSDISYLNGDCPFGLHKYRDREGHHHCSADDDERHRDGSRHHHKE